MQQNCVEISPLAASGILAEIQFQAMLQPEEKASAVQQAAVENYRNDCEAAIALLACATPSKEGDRSPSPASTIEGGSPSARSQRKARKRKLPLEYHETDELEPASRPKRRAASADV
eukprot:NODE_8763_length_539_cov_28.900485_g8740_i0.p1 GENE.NODE_8763_length_539_cov_28.900485_g8740_i0~~NODE_8763_length_539_cov_28.900485_g8740_i0.p1  ORF type:complete len:117 (-),score=17.86 NODE_8763_length_539_cov_28.900485_g8740_i0:83-433(-)